MLSDVELFVVTWFLAGVGFLSLFGFAYSSMQLWLLKTNQQITGQGFPKDSRLTEKGAIRLKVSFDIDTHSEFSCGGNHQFRQHNTSYRV